MDAIRYFEEKNRLLHSIGKTGNGCNCACCSDCPLGSKNNGRNLFCSSFEEKYPEEAIAIVEKWSQEHPQKTMLMDFFEKYPNAKQENDGTPLYVCPFELGYDDKKYCDTADFECFDCWNRPVEG